MFRLASYALVASLCAASVPAYAQSSASALTEQSMVQAIQGAGYQAQALPGNPPMYQVLAQAPWGGQVTMLVELMKNQQGNYTGYIVSAVLSGPNGTSYFDANRLTSLLKANFDVLPCSFAVRKDGSLILQMDRPFNTINAQYLGYDLQTVLRKANDTRHLWSGQGVAPVTGNTGPVVNPINTGVNANPINTGPVVNPINTGVNVNPINSGAVNLANTVWKGSEQVQGFGALEFRFFANGKAIMIDAQQTVEGTYSVQGNTVRIAFGSCVYTGTLSGNTISGTGQQNGTWNFSVTKVQ